MAWCGVDINELTPKRVKFRRSMMSVQYSFRRAESGPGRDACSCTKYVPLQAVAWMPRRWKHQYFVQLIPQTEDTKSTLKQWSSRPTWASALSRAERAGGSIEWIICLTDPLFSLEHSFPVISRCQGGLSLANHQIWSEHATCSHSDIPHQSRLDWRRGAPLGYPLEWRSIS